MSFTLAQLKTAIQDYTDNAETSFVTHLPDFIKSAEERIFKNVDLEIFRKNVTSSFTTSDKFLTIPSDYLASFSLQITTSGSEPFYYRKMLTSCKRPMMHPHPQQRLDFMHSLMQITLLLPLPQTQIMQ
jgi:hypothetical protein